MQALRDEADAAKERTDSLEAENTELKSALDTV